MSKSIVRQWPAKRVEPILIGYDEPVLDSFRDLMSRAHDREMGRLDAIERKANIVLGFGVAMIGLVMPWIFLLLPLGDRWTLTAFCCSLALASITVILAFAALQARNSWPGITDNHFFLSNPESNKSPVKVKRHWGYQAYRLYWAIWGTVQTRGTQLVWAQRALIAAVISTAVLIAFVVTGW